MNLERYTKGIMLVAGEISVAAGFVSLVALGHDAWVATAWIVAGGCLIYLAQQQQ